MRRSRCLPKMPPFSAPSPVSPKSASGEARPGGPAAEGPWPPLRWGQRRPCPLVQGRPRSPRVWAQGAREACGPVMLVFRDPRCMASKVLSWWGHASRCRTYRVGSGALWMGAPCRARLGSRENGPLPLALLSRPLLFLLLSLLEKNMFCQFTVPYESRLRRGALPILKARSTWVLGLVEIER